MYMTEDSQHDAGLEAYDVYVDSGGEAGGVPVTDILLSPDLNPKKTSAWSGHPTAGVAPPSYDNPAPAPARVPGSVWLIAAAVAARLIGVI